MMYPKPLMSTLATLGRPARSTLFLPRFIAELAHAARLDQLVDETTNARRRRDQEIASTINKEIDASCPMMQSGTRMTSPSRVRRVRVRW
jgi:hypothetical protein